MKATAKNIENGMTIQYIGSYVSKIDGRMKASCGSIKKNSPIIKVLEVKNNSQRFENLNSLTVVSECGLIIEFSTRQKINIIQ